MTLAEVLLDAMPGRWLHEREADIVAGQVQAWLSEPTQIETMARAHYEWAVKDLADVSWSAVSDSTKRFKSDQFRAAIASLFTKEGETP